MKVGFVGLGKMGANMVERLLKAGHDVVAFDVSGEAREAVSEKGARTHNSVRELVAALDAPRIVWIMVPAGGPTENTMQSLTSLLMKGDIIIEGGNSHYKDSIRRARALKMKNLAFIDVGTSGGIWGLESGYCLMIGGEKDAFQKVAPLFEALAPVDGYAHVGPSGAGHYIKMIHNGIEYAMLEAYAEGFEVMKEKEEFNLDLGQISRLWNKGSVIRSWLLELAENVFGKDTNFDSIEGYVADSGEGRWTVAEAINENIPAPIITLSLLQRLRSRQKESFSAKVIAALRNEFGGHVLKKK